MVLLGGTAAADPARADLVCPPRGPERGTALLVHGGGWLLGDPVLMQRECRGLARRGWRAVSVAYPLGDIPAAMGRLRRAVRTARRRSAMLGTRPVVMVGASAGGGMALAMAAQCRVDRALALAPAGPEWVAQLRVRVSLLLPPETDPPVLRFSSAQLGSRACSSPVRVLQGRLDHVIPLAQTRRVVERYGRRARLRVLGDVGHDIAWGEWGAARRWLLQR